MVGTNPENEQPANNKKGTTAPEEQVDNEQVDNEQVDNEQVDNEQVDPDRRVTGRASSENAKLENAISENGALKNASSTAACEADSNDSNDISTRDALDILERIDRDRAERKRISGFRTLTTHVWLLMRRVDWRLVASRRMVVCAFLFGVLNPIGCFILALDGNHWVGISPWQNGRLDTYLKLMLQWPAVLPFYPLYAFSAACLAWWCIQPAKAAANFGARFGIYTGVILSAQAALMVYDHPTRIAGFLIGLLMIVLYAVFELGIIWLLLSPVFILYDHLAGKWRHVMIASGAALFLAYIAAIFWQLPVVVPPAFFLALAAPVLSLMFYLFASLKVYFAESRPWRFSILWLLGVTTWVAAFLAAWRGSIQLMMVEYSKLPTGNPNCFVSSAAAYGLPAIVRPDQTRINGEQIRVSRQMRILKAGEFAFRTSVPRLHRLVRKAYNKWGPVAADCVRGSIWLATLCYVGFKPMEWSVLLLLKIIGIGEDDIGRLYQVALRNSGKAPD